MRPGLPGVLRTTAICCLLAGAAALLAGCCTANLTLRKCPARFDLRLTTAQPLNSCTDQGSYQVMVRVYSLTSAGAFHAAEFEDLWYGESDLGGAVLEVLKLTVEPGDAATHRWRRPPGTRALGVVANFCQLEAGCWKQVIELDEGSQRVGLHLAGTCLTLAPRP
jgi:type VI secretion system VasD/TssJ family lipoprotein